MTVLEKLGLAEEEFGGAGPHGGGDGEEVETGREGCEVGCRSPEGEEAPAAEVMDGGDCGVRREGEGAADEMEGRGRGGNADLGQCRGVVIVGAVRGCYEAVAADAGAGGVEDEFGDDRRFRGGVIVGIAPGIVTVITGIITGIVTGIVTGIITGIILRIILGIVAGIVAGNIIVVIA